MATLVKVKLEAHLRHYLLRLKIVRPIRIFLCRDRYQGQNFCMGYKYCRRCYTLYVDK